VIPLGHWRHRVPHVIGEHRDDCIDVASVPSFDPAGDDRGDRVMAEFT
jgi:hypothetical protein